jgi:flagellar capping protein FliD
MKSGTRSLALAKAIEQLNKRFDDCEKEVDLRFAKLEGQVAS